MHITSQIETVFPVLLALKEYIDFCERIGKKGMQQLSPIRHSKLASITLVLLAWRDT